MNCLRIGVPIKVNGAISGTVVELREGFTKTLYVTIRTKGNRYYDFTDASVDIEFL